MTEFKQIIGRGTRLRKDKGKWHLEILDFRNATAKFKDPSFDGDPEPPKGGEKSRSHIRLFPQILQQLTNLVKSILSMERIFVLLMR